MNTRERILAASLDLFNQRGERNISTNHIASHLGISPGNLYYHFRNKRDIVYELFRVYRRQVNIYLGLPEERPLTIEDQFGYMEAIFDGLWAFRFLHRDLEHYLDDDPRMRDEYRKFTQACLKSVAEIVVGLENSGILQPLAPAERASLTLNAWLVTTNWMSFLKTLDPEGLDETGQVQLKQGIYQIVALQLPFVTAEFDEAMRQRQRQYVPTLDVSACRFD